MNKMLMIATAAALSVHAVSASAVDRALPLTSSQAIAEQIEINGRAEPVVEFVSGTAVLTLASYRQLAELVDVLRDDPRLRIEIGFVPQEREGAAAAALAAARSRALRDALINLAAPAGRLTVRSAG